MKKNIETSESVINTDTLYTLLGNKPAGRIQHIYTVAMFTFMGAYGSNKKAIPRTIFTKFYKKVWPHHLKNGNIEYTADKKGVKLTKAGFNYFHKERDLAQYKTTKEEIQGAIQFFKDGKVDAVSSPFKGYAFSPLKTILKK